MIVQFDTPNTSNSFVHRCSKTARPNRERKAFVFLLPNEETSLSNKTEQNRRDSQFFSFGDLSQKLSTLTPQKKVEKMRLNFSQDDSTIFTLSKEAIIRNFCLNSFFKNNPEFALPILKELYEFLKEGNFSQDVLAQSIFLLHVSKADCSKMSNSIASDFFNTVFTQFRTIQISIHRHLAFFYELQEIFSIIIESQAIRDDLINAVDQIVENSGETFDFKKLSLFIFDSKLCNLNGYAGKNKVYINSNQILSLLNGDKYQDFDVKEKEISRFGDLNASSPFLTKSNTGKKCKDVAECGLEIEKSFFQQLIDWRLSLTSRVINFSYCEEFLKNFIQNRVIQFDSTKSKFKLRDPKDILAMGLDYTMPFNYQYF
ncbi:unnamed protein product [Brachionus calyciflorus]|uniref:Uncharacterized protein n=1 Tax=Brachionus calyciflorus TaxID=104777 RepID=A0A814FVJ0_9BILA|nr:unnamed protein product [Brachionus calyciflorus]